MFRNFKILDEKDKRLRMISKEVTFPLSKEEKDTIKKTKKVIEIYGIVFIVMFLLISFLENDLILGLIIISAMCLVICFCLFIVFLFDKKDVNNINKKIKENEEKRE